MEFLNITDFGSKSSFKKRKHSHHTTMPLLATDSSDFQKIFPSYIVKPKCLRRMTVLWCGDTLTKWRFSGCCPCCPEVPSVHNIWNLTSQTSVSNELIHGSVVSVKILVYIPSLVSLISSLRNWTSSPKHTCKAVNPVQLLKADLLAEYIHFLRR